MDSQGILLFTTESAAGSASSDYDKDAFQDISLPASNNSGLTSTVSTNPLGGYFANDLAPKWMAKTLWIKDLVRVEDRTLWINGRATYKILWNESFPGVDGYAFGAVQLQGTSESRYISINDIGDGCGVTGLIRRVQWIIRPKSGTATATPSIDGSGLTQINFGGYTGLGTSFATTKPTFNAYTTQSSNASADIHDHRLVADQSNNLEVVGAVVYFNIPGDGINCFGGTGFVDKVQTSPPGSSLVYPTGVSNLLGGVDSIFVNSNGIFGLTSSPTPGVAANCSGASGTNLLNVGIGTGASFPIGTGILIPDGASYYLGSITSVSGDVLTVSPTFATGVSNICSALFNAGASFAINYTTMEQAFSFQPGVDVRLPLGATGYPSEQPYSFSDSALRFRAWGSTLRLVSGASISTGLASATLGLLFPTNTDFLQFEGRYSALEFEFMVGQSALLSATLSIDGMYAQGITVPLSGPTVYRRSIFANGANGFHSVRYAETGSTNVLLTRITGYRPKTYQGPSYGLLAEIPTGITFLTRNAQNASLMAFGNVTRVYSESIRCNGASWGSTAMLTASGGRFLTTVAPGDYAEFQYFGTQFSLGGTLGATFNLTVDGASTAASMDSWLGAGLTLGFHSVRLTHQGTSMLMLSRFDFLNPYHAVRNKQTYDPLANYSIMPRAWSQTSEPTNARLGDIWELDVANKVAYQKIFGGWQRYQGAATLAYGVNTLGSSLFSTSSATPVDILNMGVTLTLSGNRRIFMRALGRAEGNESYFAFSRGSDQGNALVYFQWGSTLVSLMRFGAQANGVGSITTEQAPSAFYAESSFIPPAGTYFLKMLASTPSGTFSALRCQFSAGELPNQVPMP